jgi:hypothetical protein
LPRKLIDEPDFRVVETVIGDEIVHVLETRDGVDAMELERWRRFNLPSKELRQIFSYLVRVALETECQRSILEQGAKKPKRQANCQAVTDSSSKTETTESA